MMEEEFSWVETHKQLANYLKNQQNNQKGLIDLLRNVGISPFNDKSKKGDFDTTLDEIDPFTFFCYIHKYGSDKRISILQSLAEKLNLFSPTGDFGIPSSQPQRVWLFPYKYLRKNNEVARLWSFFNKAIERSLTDEDFEDVLTIPNVGKIKLTEGLFYIKPKDYLPINGPTIPYIKEVLKINSNFKTYSEYASLLEEIRKKTDEPFYKISYDAWDWNIKQKNKKTSYWVFQGNPKAFDLETAIKEGLVDDWTVSAHKDKIKIGDKVILWITGDKSGCYALAEVTSEPQVRLHSPDDHLWKVEDKSELKVGIKITHNLVENPILKEEISSIKKLSQLKVGNQGTNFASNQEEFEAMLEIAENKTNKKYWLFAPGENASKWDEFYESGIMGLGWDKLGDIQQYNNREEIRLALIEAYGGGGSKKNNVNANYDFVHTINLGDIIIVKKGRSDLLGYGEVASNYIYDENRLDYNSIRKVDWKLKGNWRVDFNLVLKTLTDITSYSTDDEKYNTYYERLMGIMTSENPSLENSYPINSILFGAPGTGKTYTLKRDYFPKYTISEKSITPEAYFEDVVSGLTWWQVIALSLLEMGTSKVNDILENKWVSKKANLSESKNVRATIWGNLQFHTIIESETVNYTQRQSPYIFNKTKDKKWELIVAELKEQAPEIYDILDSVNKFEPNPNKEIKHYVFTTFHQSFSYEDFIEGIKPVIEEGKEELTYQIENGIFKELCLKAQNDPANRYAIFIDEINRGNVSAIFGELISLIEPDKRLGAENELKVKLPYSKREFGVPKNVDIYGTMNTADRSVEALDTALRRRFSFIEMQPEPKVLSDSDYQDVDLKQLLEIINQRIEILIDKDHQIGHSYFIGIKNLEELKLVFKDKIIPLLEEYFYGDFGKIGLVLGGSFIFKEDNNVRFPKNFIYENDFLEEKIVYRFTSFESWDESSFKAIYEDK